MESEQSSAHVAYRAVLLAAALLVFGLVFRQLLTLMLAVLMTVIIAIPVAAVATRLQRRGVPRALGAMVALLGAIAAIALLVYLLIPPFVDETHQFVRRRAGDRQRPRDRIQDITGAKPSEVGDTGPGVLPALHRRPGAPDRPDHLDRPERGRGDRGADPDADHRVLHGHAPGAARSGDAAAGPPPRRAHAHYVLERLRNAWLGWMAGVAVDMLVTGVLLYIGLRLVGLNFAVFFAVLTALLTLVPYFGAIAGALPPVLFALTDSPGKALVVLAVYVVVQQVESKVTIPLIMSQDRPPAPGGDRNRRGRGGPAVRRGGPARGDADPAARHDRRGGVLGQAARGGRARAGPEVLELRDGDDRAGEHEDHDQDLHDDPEAGKLQTRATR